MKAFLALLVAVLAIGVNGQTGPCANIRTRGAWGSRSTNPAWLATQPPNAFVVHHTDGARCSTVALCDQQMRNIQNFHMNTNGWADIGYNFCIGDTNQVYEGRGWNRAGAHSPGFNSRSIGFCFMGAFHTVLPSQAVLNTAQAFVICARDWGRLTTTYRLLGHRQDVATTCPGNALFSNIQTWPRWS
ncbi:CLUMA_CG018019, isoform A [Clunio marinus]|uniref:Peptidoglycan-recognition protein n=1 Tax=Clunio marinus TaxID=568069 RepID=A0A1J1J0I3_9DIPT|nr:CLUMA_CG018019, isoform A [Clunio marinus]